MSPARLAALAALVLALALAVAGCSSTPTPTVVPSATAAPSASPSASAPRPTAPACDPSAPMPSAVPTQTVTDPDAVLHQAIEAKVVEIRGLTPTAPVAPQVLDAVGLCALLRETMARENPTEYTAATERLYKQLMLIPQDASLLRLYLDLYAGQVIGVYDQYAKHLYVVAGTGVTSALGQITYAHEFTHALQDQAFDLRKLQGAAKDQGDRSLAITSLVEGDAVLSMSLWAQAALTPQQLAEAAGATDPASAAALDAAPAILREPLLFAYNAGMRMAVSAYQNAGGYSGVDAMFATPPTTTEQVLHPDKLAAREPGQPVVLPLLRLGVDWKVTLEDTLGELQLDILLRDAGGVDPVVSKAATAGWGGDRLALIEGPGGATGVVLDTAWDSAQDADEFAAALETLAAKLRAAGRGASVEQSNGRVFLITGDSEGTAMALQGALFGAGG